MKSISKFFLYFVAISTSTTTCLGLALAPKKIFLTFDGTRNNAKNHVPDPENNRTFTNVLKLHVLAGGDIYNRVNNVEGQVCLYERGVGGSTNSNIISKKEFIGGELDKQVIPMMEKLEEVYEEGDKVYIVGFSRGSASARAFSVELNKNGLAKSGGKSIPIEFLGCFDTVSMQVKKNLIDIAKTAIHEELTSGAVLGETNGKLPANIKKAVHFVSLDDNRFAGLKPLPFPPCFMDSGDTRVTEIWFPGSHCDVGGTYYKKGIPDNACKKMQEYLEKEGIGFIEPEDIPKECVKIGRFPQSRNLFPVQVNPLDLDIAPNTSDEIRLKEKNQSSRPVVTVSNEEEIVGGKPKIDVGVLEHYEAMEKKGTPYDINPEIKKADFVVVGSFGKELEAETKRLKELLGMKTNLPAK